MPKINDRLCKHCGTLFHPTTGDINRGKGRFCSYSCGSAHRARPLADRFFEGVGKKLPNGCIAWAGSTNFRISAGRRGGQLLVASRAAYELMVGPIPPGLVVCHRCDNGFVCINPTHLFLGTQAVNMADMTAKGRQARGERLARTGLTDEAVRQIRYRASQGESQTALSREFKISRALCCLIVNRQRWAHVA